MTKITTKLTDLNPWFVDTGGLNITDKYGNPKPTQKGVGLSCDCPCGCNEPLFVHFEIALDGSKVETSAPTWQRLGHTFETITLKPSLKRIGGCGWHGWLTNGVFTSC